MFVALEIVVYVAAVVAAVVAVDIIAALVADEDVQFFVV